MTVTTHDELHSSVLAKASDCEEFRAALIDDPRTALKDNFGVQIPDSLNVQVHEDSAEHVHLVLPDDGRLNEDELASLSGGTTWDSSMSN